MIRSSTSSPNLWIHELTIAMFPFLLFTLLAVYLIIFGRRTEPAI